MKLTVTDDHGLIVTEENEIEVLNVPPMAKFTVPEAIYTNVTTTFDVTASHDPDGEIVKYQWDFNGDGVVDAEGQKVTWTFTGESTYTVVRIVTDNDGATAEAKVEVHVEVGGSGGPA